MKGRPGQVSDGSARWIGRSAYNLLQSLCGTKTSWAGTDDENIDVAGDLGQHGIWCCGLCRKRDIHLLAIGLTEVALVGLGPVGVVGGSAGHGEEMWMVQQRCVLCTGYSAMEM